MRMKISKKRYKTMNGCIIFTRWKKLVGHVNGVLKWDDLARYG
jgi:hypothetical protein